jgi:hypothetical protein
VRLLSTTLVVALAASATAALAQDKAEDTLAAVIGLQAKIPPNARSADSLGSQRRGTGVLIRDGYVLTIGYLVIEAESAVSGEHVSTLAEFYRRIWGRGGAGVEVPIRVLQGAQLREVSVRSIDRVDYFRASKTY